MRDGDIYLNTWASKDNPVRIFIVTSLNEKIVYGKCVEKGKLTTVRYYACDVKTDTEHFKKIGHLDLSKIIIDKLNELKKKEDEQNE